MFLQFAKKLSLDGADDLLALDWVQAMQNCLQSPEHHAEGDVWVHVKMVLSEVLRDNRWKQLSHEEQADLFLTALLHDIAKPKTFEVCPINGNITANGHARLGAIMARELLYKEGVPYLVREKICNIIKYHLKPFFLIEMDNSENLAREIRLNCELEQLAIHARADILGRICQDQNKALDNVELFEEFCKEIDLSFANDHSRLLYFQNRLKHPYEAYFEPRCYVTVMSGLPGAGKDRWIAKNANGRPVVSLDNIRREMGYSPTKPHGPVLAKAYDVAEEHLRNKTDFIWNATNISRSIRSNILGIAMKYNAHIQIVYVEVPYKELLTQNRDREYSVPTNVIEKLVRKVEPPDLTEAHEILKIGCQ